jgi:hypothetical protein
MWKSNGTTTENFTLLLISSDYERVSCPFPSPKLGGM